MLYKRNNIYYTSYYHNGKRYRQSLHTDKENIAVSREYTIMRFLDQNAVKTGEIIYWKDLKAWYFNYLKSNKSTGTQFIHLRAVELMENWRIPYYTRSITPDFLISFKEFLRTEYKDKHAAGRNRYVRALKTMMRIAEKQGKIGIRQDWTIIARDKDEKDNRIEYHTITELSQIKHALKDKEDLLTVFYLGWACGLRRGEMAHLYKTDYNAKTHTISITEKPDWKPKTKKSIRTIPLTPEAEEAIIKSINRAPHSPYLINLDGNRDKAGYLCLQYINVLKRSLPHLHCYLHKLRHTFGSILIEKDTHIKVVSELMGHKNILQTEKYVHIGDKQQVKAIEKLPKI